MARVALLFSLIFLVGCGGGDKSQPVTGKVLENGSPYKFNDGKPLPPGVAGVTIEFIRTDGAKGESYPVVFQATDSTFTIQTQKDRKGLPAGKYRIAISFGAGGTPGGGEGAFGRENSPLTVDIPEGKPSSVTIDIGKKTATVS